MMEIVIWIDGCVKPFPYSVTRKVNTFLSVAWQRKKFRVLKPQGLITNFKRAVCMQDAFGAYQKYF